MQRAIGDRPYTSFRYFPQKTDFFDSLTGCTFVQPVLVFFGIYQITTRLEGARYIPSVFFTPKVVYHSVKFLGGILARR